MKNMLKVMEKGRERHEKDVENSMCTIISSMVNTV